MPCTLFEPCVLSSQLVERGREPKVFWGRRFRQGRSLSDTLHALILMGDWCGLSNEPDTIETKTRARGHQVLCRQKRKIRRARARPAMLLPL